MARHPASKLLTFAVSEKLFIIIVIIQDLRESLRLLSLDNANRERVGYWYQAVGVDHEPSRRLCVDGHNE